MATPTPSPDFPEVDQPPAPPTPPAVPSGPTCTACSSDAVVHWQRRPTTEELAEVVQAEKDRREQLLLLADPQLPAPEFGPLPTADGTTRTVYACGPHAITMDAAALIHTSGCTAPNNADLPGCDCTPEPPPQAPADDDQAPSRLPAHWQPEGQ
jgi:hypothetical protein